MSIAREVIKWLFPWFAGVMAFLLMEDIAHREDLKTQKKEKLILHEVKNTTGLSDLHQVSINMSEDGDFFLFNAKYVGECKREIKVKGVFEGGKIPNIIIEKGE